MLKSAAKLVIRPKKAFKSKARGAWGPASGRCSVAALLLASELLGGDFASCAVLVGVLDFGPKCSCQILLAGCRIQVGQVKLRYRSEEHTSELQSLRHLV